MLKIKPHHVGLSVENLEESIQWYTDILGFQLVNVYDIDLLQAREANLINGAFQVDLIKYESSKKVPEEMRIPNIDIRTCGTKHICFEVEDIEEAFKIFNSKNVDVVFGPVEMMCDKMGFIRDPSGILIEMLEVRTIERKNNYADE